GKVLHCEADYVHAGLGPILSPSATPLTQGPEPVYDRCFRTMPTVALENEMSLLPPRFRLHEKILKAITRMQTLPPFHPLYKWIQQAHQNSLRNMPFLSNLGNIMKHYPEYISEIETIHPYLRPPWGSLKTTIHININKEKVKDQ